MALMLNAPVILDANKKSFLVAVSNDHLTIVVVFFFSDGRQLFATIVKFGWFDREKDDFLFRSVISDVMKFIEVSLAGH